MGEQEKGSKGDNPRISENISPSPLPPLSHSHPPTFRIICEELYARAVPPELLTDPDYEWRIFPDLGGDYPLICVRNEEEWLPLPARSEEGRAVLGEIDLEVLHEQAVALNARRQCLYAALAEPCSLVVNSPLYRLFAVIAAHGSLSSLSPFIIKDAADRIISSRFDPEEIVLDLGPYRDDILQVRQYIEEREATGENYWDVVIELLDVSRET